MRPGFFNREHLKTAFIQLDTGKCKACWKCREACPNHVIGVVDLPWHKHSIFINGSNCTGCLKCVRVCEPNALSKITAHKAENTTPGKSLSPNLLMNVGLLLSGLFMAVSGIVIQFNYHMGQHGEIDLSRIVWGFDYFGWSDIHKIAVVFLSVLMVFHFKMHSEWYNTVFKKNLVSRNKQVIILSIVFILVAVTGYIPWFIKISGGQELTRKVFIEIHDKLALILFVYLVLHVSNRLKWFITAIKK
jgi:2-oxoglutarate ferredoxin oxidoreductase subunit delta